MLHEIQQGKVQKSAAGKENPRQKKMRRQNDGEDDSMVHIQISPTLPELIYRTD